MKDIINWVLGIGFGVAIFQIYTIFSFFGFFILIFFMVLSNIFMYNKTI